MRRSCFHPARKQCPEARDIQATGTGHHPNAGAGPPDPLTFSALPEFQAYLCLNSRSTAKEEGDDKHHDKNDE